MCLGAEDAGMPLAILAADYQFQAGQNLFGNAAQAINLNKAVGFHLTDDEAQLVHMTEDHSPGQAGICAGNLGNDIAHPIDPNLFTVLLQIGLQLVSHIGFVTAGCRGQHKILQNFFRCHSHCSLSSKIRSMVCSISTCE